MATCYAQEQKVAPSPQQNGPRILIVDDDLGTCLLVCQELRDKGFGVEVTTISNEALRKLATERYDGLLLDLLLSGESGLESMPRMLATSPRTKIWVLTGYQSISAVVTAMKGGATGFFSKDANATDVVAEISNHLSTSNDTCDLASFADSFGMVGKSDAMRRLVDRIHQMKDVDSTVLVCGESGTGKELVARALHRNSVRGNSLFTAVNCGAIPEHLLESELFGHRRGAFTDAKADRKGIFELCSTGTLLLDEISEMPLSLQVKLLRVLQEKEIFPIGSNACIRIDTRVIASTNRRLENEVQLGRFREDLFYRISVLRIECPPLRERIEDIPLLVNYFVERFNERFGKRVSPPRTEVMAHLMAYPWPGNVRELQNTIERGVVLSTDNEFHFEDVISVPTGDPSSYLTDEASDSFVAARQSFEKRYLTELLRKSRGNVSQAARIAKQHRPRLYRLFHKYRLDPGKFKDEAPLSTG